MPEALYFSLFTAGVSPTSEDKGKKSPAATGAAPATAAVVAPKVEPAPSVTEGEPSPKKAKPAGIFPGIEILLSFV